MNGSTSSGRIVVGVDGSPHARRALRWAAAEAAQRGAELDVVMAWTLLGDEAHDKVDPKASDDKARAALRQILHEELGDEGDAAADRVQLTVVNDLAAKALLHAGEGADLLVVGSRGLGGFRELLLGSVSSQVVRHAPVRGGGDPGRGACAGPVVTRSVTVASAGPTMRAWAVEHPGPIDGGPLVAVERPRPEPGPGEVRIAVSACGVCRTDLHLAEGDLAPKRPGVVPGHEIVGVVDRLGPGAHRFQVGDRIGVAWLRHTCGTCRFCLRGDENLCLTPRFTGWDDDGGYAEAAVVPEDYAYRLPDGFDDEHAAPLLCAGIIGYRALRRAALPPGGRLGIYGFGASAHLAAQVALYEGARVHVLTRSADAQRLALELGAASAAGAIDAPPEPLDAAVLFAPAGDLVPVALRALDRAGTLAIAGIHLSTIPALDYDTDLFEERQVRSVTANTRRDGEELLALAASIPLRPVTSPYAFDQADRALADLAHDQVQGGAVLHMG